MQSTITKINKKIGGSDKSFTAIAEEISSSKSIFIIILSFLTSGISFIGTAIPFVFAIYAVALHFRIIPFVILCITILGLALSGATTLPVFIVSCVLYTFLRLFIKNKKPIFKSIILSCCYLVASVVVSIINGYSSYDLLYGFLFAVLTGLLFVIYKKAISGIEEIGSKIKLKNEKYAAIFIVFIIALSPAVNYSIANINIGVITYIFVAILCSFYGSVGYASVFTVSIMFVGFLSGFADMFLFILLAVTSLVCALTNRGTKAGTVIGAILAWVVAAVTFSTAGDVNLYPIETALGIIFFITFPKQAGNYFFDMIKVNNRNNDILFGSIGELTGSKLTSMSNMLNKISKLIPNKKFKNTEIKNDAYSLIDIAVGKICENCSRCAYCWEDNFYSTYQAVFAAVAVINSGDNFSEKDLPKRFKRDCNKINEIVKSINNSYEIFKMDKVYRQRIDNIKDISCKQLSNLALYIDDYYSNIQKTKSLCKDIENELFNLLISIDVCPKDIYIYKPAKDLYIVELLYGKNSDYEKDLDLILSIVSRLTGKKIEYDISYFGENHDIKLTCKPEKKYKVTTWTAKKAALDNSVSGDSYTFFENMRGVYVAAVGDGMGTGKKAYEKSNMVMNLIECLYDESQDHSSAVKIINSFLALKTEQESFSTIDMCMLNLYSGEVDFLKAGGCSTFIHDGKDIKLLDSDSAPVGILSHPDTYSVKDSIDDTLISVMLTDGILDVISENDVRYIISSCDYNDYQYLADKILKTALKKCQNTANDDMLVMVNKMWKI